MINKLATVVTIDQWMICVQNMFMCSAKLNELRLSIRSTSRGLIGSLNGHELESSERWIITKRSCRLHKADLSFPFARWHRAKTLRTLPVLFIAVLGGDRGFCRGRGTQGCGGWTITASSVPVSDARSRPRTVEPRWAGSRVGGRSGDVGQLWKNVLTRSYVAGRDDVICYRAPWWNRRPKCRRTGVPAVLGVPGRRHRLARESQRRTAAGSPACAASIGASVGQMSASSCNGTEWQNASACCMWNEARVLLRVASQCCHSKKEKSRAFDVRMTDSRHTCVRVFVCTCV